MVAVVDVVALAGYASVKDATAGTIHHWRIASHRHLRLKMNVRHRVVQHHRGQNVTLWNLWLPFGFSSWRCTRRLRPSTVPAKSNTATYHGAGKRVSGSASGRTGSACSSAPELSLGRRSGSGPQTPRGKSQSTRTWKPTNNQVVQTLITASSEIAPTAESKLSSFVEPLIERTSNEQVVMVSLFQPGSSSPMLRSSTLLSEMCLAEC